jgi:hypothetical protein
LRTGDNPRARAAGSNQKRSNTTTRLRHRLWWLKFAPKREGDVGQWCCSFQATSNNPHNNQSSISDCNQPVSTSMEVTSSAKLAHPNALAMWHTALVWPTWAPIRRESMSKDQRRRIHDNLDGTPNNQSE